MVRPSTCLVLLVLGGVLVVGCGVSEEEKQRNATTAMRIQAELLRNPDVVEAKVWHLHTPTNNGNAEAQILVRYGRDIGSVVDQGVRLIWTSDLVPLKSIHVAASNSETRPGVGRKYMLPEQQSELVAKFGPRPKLDGDDDERHAWLFVVVILVILVALVVAGGVLVRRRGRPLPQPSVRLDPGVARYFSDPGGEPRDPWAPPPGS